MRFVFALPADESLYEITETAKDFRSERGLTEYGTNFYNFDTRQPELKFSSRDKP